MSWEKNVDPIRCCRCGTDASERYYNVVVNEIVKTDREWIGTSHRPIYYESFCPKCIDFVLNEVRKYGEIY